MTSHRPQDDRKRRFIEEKIEENEVWPERLWPGPYPEVYVCPHSSAALRRPDRTISISGVTKRLIIPPWRLEQDKKARLCAA